MKTTLIIIIYLTVFLFYNNTTKGQELSLKQLIHLSDLCNSLQINDYLIERGWEIVKYNELDRIGDDFDNWILSENNTNQNWLFFTIDAKNT